MLVRKLVCLAAVMSVCFVIVDQSSSRADDFFKNKTIHFVVGFPPGGGFDNYTRLIARHFGKHVPGNPSTVVMNMPGAGSLIGANHIYNKAKPDGLTIGNFIGPLVLQQVLGNKAAQFDGRKFGWLGVPVADHGVCVTNKASGVRNVEEWLALKRPLKIGTVAPGSTAEDIPRLLQAALGLPMQMVSGFQGTTQIRLAIESGEVEGGCWGWESIKATWGNAIESGNINVVIQPRLKSHPDLTHVPLAIKFAKTTEAKQLIHVLNDVYGETVRPYAVPPGTPKDRVEILQNAFLSTMKDREFVAAARKTQTDVDPLAGPTAAKIFASLYEYPPGLINRLKDILIPKK